MPQVFGCPNCQNPFQVPDDAAGQAFQCPTCKTTVEVPAPAPDPIPATPETEIFACPHCAGQFGINASMYGEELACPHCSKQVAVERAPQQTIVPPVITEPKSTQPVVDTEQTAGAQQTAEVKTESTVKDKQPQPTTEKPTTEKPEQAATTSEAPVPPEPVFEPQSVDHLLPPRFDVPDPVRFPHRSGSSAVILPDGKGGYQSVDPNIVTITHKGEVYHLKRLTPEERQRRRLIHSSIAIVVAVLLIFLTLQTLGFIL